MNADEYTEPSSNLGSAAHNEGCNAALNEVLTLIIKKMK